MSYRYHLTPIFKDQPRVRAYSFILAQKYQQIIENPFMSVSQHQAIIMDISEVNDCINQSIPYGSDFTMPYVLNTYGRSLAYIKGLSQLKGTILPPKRRCQ